MNSLPAAKTWFWKLLRCWTRIEVATSQSAMLSQSTMSQWIQTSSKEERLRIRSWAHSWTTLRALVEIKTVLSHLKSFATTTPTFQWALLQTSTLLEWWSQLGRSQKKRTPKRSSRQWPICSMRSKVACSSWLAATRPSSGRSSTTLT